MESLFKFALQRPAVKKPKEFIIDLSQVSDYQVNLAKILKKDKNRELIKSLSSKYVSSKSFITETSTLKNFKKLVSLQKGLDQLVLKENVTKDDLEKLVQNSFGSKASDVIKGQPFINDITNLKDSVLAIKYLPEHHNKPIEELSKALKDLKLIEQIAENTGVLKSGSSLKEYRKRPLKLPSEADLKSILIQREEERKKELERQKQELEKRKKLVAEKTTLYKNLQVAVKEIMKIDSSLLDVTLQKPHKGTLIPKEISPLNIFRDQIQKMGTMGQLQVLNAKNQLKEGSLFRDAFKLQSTSINLDENSSAKTIQSRDFYSSSAPFKPLTNLATQFKFKIAAEKQLSKQTTLILKDRGLSITKMGIDKVVGELRFEMDEISDELEILTQSEKTTSFKRIGNTMVITSTPKISMWGLMSTLSYQEINKAVFDSRIPRTKGSVTPSGIADLLIVKQQLKGYEGKDVAHIENILKGEKKNREHRRFDQTISETSIETETVKVEERELESTDRFELSREASKTIKSEASLKAGLSISGSYGPVVSFSVSAEGSLSTSKEEATKTASNFSKDVTQKSVEKLSERVQESSKIMITNEVEETNSHALDNSAGNGHVSGVYQWVEKVYEAQMYNYGIRMMFDFMIPEPGAYLVESMQKAHANTLELQKPVEFTLKPNQISESNYNSWIHLYGATGITPPPEEYITKSINYNAGGGDSKTDYTHSGVIQIDEGYKAIYSAVGKVINKWEDNWTVDVVVGRRTHRFTSGDWMWTTGLNDETESIPFAVKTSNVGNIALTAEVKCARTSRAMKKWQLDTHAKLVDAYNAKLADYEEKLATLEMQAGVEIEGKNPDLNLEIMKDELKKDCITLLTEQHFDLFDAIETGTNGLPQIDLHENEAEGPYVRFFEQAFEWEHITWLTYPYFWGRKDKWEERIAYEDPDPLFNQFIKAGYCRVNVPVRPGFEGAVDHFMTFGEIWNGGPLPAISSELYLPIADELAERLDKPGDEVPQGEPWEVRIPTNLVKLRADDALPKWQKDNDGNWVEA